MMQIRDYRPIIILRYGKHLTAPNYKLKIKLQIFYS